MIGYIVEQELGNVLPEDRPFASLLTMIEVDPADPAFADPTKFVGPVYDKEQADVMAGEKGWVFRQDGEKWRRVVASPAPKRIFEIQPVKWLVEKNTVVVCAGGGGIPTAFAADGSGALQGVEAVIDKDWASELLARDLGADVYVMATDTDGVYLDWGTPSQRLIDRATPAELAQHAFPGWLDGPQGRCSLPFRPQDGQACGHRRTEGHPGDRRRHRRDAGGRLARLVWAPELTPELSRLTKARHWIYSLCRTTQSR